MMWNMIKVNIKNTRTTSFWFFYGLFWTYFATFSSVSIVNFKQVNVIYVQCTYCDHGERTDIEIIASWLANICSNQTNNIFVRCLSLEIQKILKNVKSIDDMFCFIRRMENFFGQSVIIISTCTVFTAMWKLLITW